MVIKYHQIVVVLYGLKSNPIRNKQSKPGLSEYGPHNKYQTDVPLLRHEGSHWSPDTCDCIYIQKFFEYYMVENIR